MKHFIYIVVFLVIFALCGCATLQRYQNQFSIENLVLCQTVPREMGKAEEVDYVLYHNLFCVYFETKNVTVRENNGEKWISITVIGRVWDGGELLYENAQIEYEGCVRDDYDPEIHGWGYLVFYALQYGKYRAEIEGIDRYSGISSKKSIFFEVWTPGKGYKA